MARKTDVSNLPLIRHGSSSDIYRFDQSSIVFDCTDWFSVFDVGRAKQKIPGKGKNICAAAMSSDWIARRLGIPTCVIEQLSDTAIRVHEAQILRAPTKRDEGYLVPLEFIDRFEVAGSYGRDFQNGTRKPEKYGLLAGMIPPFGTPFPYPVHMTTTKLEDVDREVKVPEACLIGGLTRRDLAEYWSMIDRFGGGFTLALACYGFRVADGKKECIMGPGRRKSFGDLCGNQDGDRIYEVVDGEVIHLGKEYLRQLYIDMGYFAALKKARAEGQPDIPIPELPLANIEEASRRYARVGDTYGRMEKK